MSGTSMRDVFWLLGFEEDWQAMTDSPPAYAVDLGNIQIKAAEVAGRSFRPIFLIRGHVKSDRTLREIASECHLTVASVEQGVALIAHAIGDDIEPDRPVPWLELGRKWRDRLPAAE
jgi:hypothetical protein